MARARGTDAPANSSLKALLIGGAQLVGGSMGPLAASFFVTDTDARGALYFSLTYVALAAVTLISLHATRPRTA